MSNCIYRLEDGAYCTKHSGSFYDLDCQEDRGISCRDKKLPTNYETLIHKSPEEVAEWIDEFWAAAWCPGDPPVDPETKRCLVHDGDCRLCILDWLKQGAKDG